MFPPDIAPTVLAMDAGARGQHAPPFSGVAALPAGWTAAAEPATAAPSSDRPSRPEVTERSAGTHKRTSREHQAAFGRLSDAILSGRNL